MDELETRLAALEGLLMERLALDSQPMIARLIDMVATWPEDDQRAQALQILDDALRRFDEFASGQRLRPGG